MTIAVAIVYPHAPGFRKAETSILAAIKVQGPAKWFRRRALEEFRRAGWDGLTSDEVIERTGIERRHMQPRVAELKKLNLIVKAVAVHPTTGETAAIRRLNNYGNLCEVLRYAGATHGNEQLPLF